MKLSYGSRTIVVYLCLLSFLKTKGIKWYVFIERNKYRFCVASFSLNVFMQGTNTLRISVFGQNTNILIGSIQSFSLLLVREYDVAKVYDYLTFI